MTRWDKTHLVICCPPFSVLTLFSIPLRIDPTTDVNCHGTNLLAGRTIGEFHHIFWMTFFHQDTHSFGIGRERKLVMSGLFPHRFVFTIPHQGHRPWHALQLLSKFFLIHWFGHDRFLVVSSYAASTNFKCPR
jgi:hypothetical protein